VSSDGDIARKSSAIKSIAARPDSSTPAWVTPARNAVCVLLNTAISTSTMSESSVITTSTSTRVKPFTIFDLRFTIETAERAVPPDWAAIGNRQSAIGNLSFMARG